MDKKYNPKELILLYTVTNFNSENNLSAMK